MKLIGNIVCEEEGNIMVEQEQANTASQEMEVARRLLAKKVVESLESAFEHSPESLDMLAGILAKLASWDFSR